MVIYNLRTEEGFQRIHGLLKRIQEKKQRLILTYYEDNRLRFEVYRRVERVSKHPRKNMLFLDLNHTDYEGRSTAVTRVFQEGEKWQDASVAFHSLEVK